MEESRPVQSQKGPFRWVRSRPSLESLRILGLLRRPRLRADGMLRDSASASHCAQENERASLRRPTSSRAREPGWAVSGRRSRPEMRPHSRGDPWTQLDCAVDGVAGGLRGVRHTSGVPRSKCKRYDRIAPPRNASGQTRRASAKTSGGCPVASCSPWRPAPSRHGLQSSARTRRRASKRRFKKLGRTAEVSIRGAA